jgi:hypothetical protein
MFSIAFPKRPAIFVVSMIAPSLLLGTLSIAQEQKPAKPELSKDKFKNIKILKNLPADQMIPLMRKIDASLGVKCDFCHVIKADHTGFELDDKPMKNMARQMIVMTQDINKKNKSVKNQVTCFTCHRGHAEPENTAPAAP